MGNIVVATVDSSHALIIVEALDDAGIAAEVIEVKAFNQLAYLRQQQRPSVDIQVDEAQAAAAREVLAKLALDNEQALEMEMESGAPPGEKLEAREDPQPRRSKSRGLAVALGLLFPLIGPLYANAPALLVASAIVHLPLFVFLFSNHALARELVVVSWALGRLVDVIGTLRCIIQYNDGLAKAAASHEGEPPHATHP